MKDYRVELDVYNGPLDLLLFLIRREEVDIYDIPIAVVTEQYIAYVRMIERFDPDAAGDFLVLAATLMEIKSRTLLPRPPVDDEEEDFTDPRLELVRQLLEYKRFKDAARQLGLAGEVQALKHPRQPPPLASDARGLDLDDVGIWDLFDAFNRLLEQTGRRELAHEVVYDDTPLALHATDILDSLERADGAQHFEAIFEGRSKGQLIGLFLALLELIRKRRVRAQQDEPFGAITIVLLDASSIEAGFDDAFEAESEEPELGMAAAETEEPQAADTADPAASAGEPIDSETAPAVLDRAHAGDPQPPAPGEYPQLQ